MTNTNESGYFNSNKFARIYLSSIQEITGLHGLNSILNFASLPGLVGQLPPDDLKREFDFAHFSRINQALEEIYGERGGRGISLRVGMISFDDILKDYGELAGVGAIEFKVLPPLQKVKFGLEAMARLFSEMSDQTSRLDEHEEHFSYQIERCPICWGRTEANNPVCYYMVGLLKEGLNWVSGGKEYQVREDRCIALGDAVCEFIIPKQPTA